MTESPANLQFNALTDRWLPLVQDSGETVWSSPVEILCGEKDGKDLDYPRDDFRVYARLLLSALVQALFPAADKRELKARLETPLSRGEVENRIGPVLGDFDLFGATPFLQIVPPNDPKTSGGAAPFIFRPPDLYQPAIAIVNLSLPVALVTLFAEQTFAGGGGSGHAAGPGGEPGALTLVDAGSLRASVWANTLELETYGPKYGLDDERPWLNAIPVARPRGGVGLVGGLFYQPRGIWLIRAGSGNCSFTGRMGPVVRLSPFLPKSKPLKEDSGRDIWVHPCAPLAVNSIGIAPVRLKAGQPAWTGLAQLLAPISKGNTRMKHPSEGPARTVTQWRALGKWKGLRLLVLAFDRKQAKVKSGFFEAFPLTLDLLDKKEGLEMMRDLVDTTENIVSTLVKALTRAHDNRKVGGLALADARSSFWATSEALFFDWLATVVAIDGATDAGWGRLEQSRDTMLDALRGTAISIFNAHAELSEFDPRKQQRIAAARRFLCRALWQKHGALPPTQTVEVSP